MSIIIIYDNNSSMIAKISENHILNIIGEEIGYVDEGNIFVADNSVGRYTGFASAGAAAVILIFNKGVAVYDS